MNRMVLFCLLLPFPALAQGKLYERELLLMGTAFQISVISDNEATANEGIDSAIHEIKRIENLISEWKESSETSAIIRNAGITPVKVSPELFGLISRCIKISELTEGAFDITFSGLGSLYSFDKMEHDLPTDNTIKEHLRKVGYKKIILDKENETVYLAESGMKMGFGAIGKGYAANCAKRLLLELGFKNGVVNAAGDLNAWGKNIDKPWSIGIASPEDGEEVIAWLEANDNSIVTSGNYEKYFINNGKRYSHIIDPRTGYPATGLKSVTIITSDAEVGDALATSVFVLGEEKGLELVEQLKGIECLLIDDNNNVLRSNGLKLDTKK